ncbi:MAG: hypothetical protein ACLQF0_05595 [Dissulfurispiraceae bacterium]
MHILKDLFVTKGKEIVEITSCADKALDVAAQESAGLKDVVVENWKGETGARFFDGALIEADDSVLFGEADLVDNAFYINDRGEIELDHDVFFGDNNVVPFPSHSTEKVGLALAA